MKVYKRLAAVTVLAGAILLSGCASGQKQQSMADYIGIDAAQEAALEAAGVSADQADFSVSGLDSHDGIFYYEVKFTSGDKEYEYDIDALTGVVIEEAITPAGTVAAETTQAAVDIAMNESPEAGASGAVGSGPAAAGQSNNTAPQSQGQTAGAQGPNGSGAILEPELTEEEAKQIALENAGVSDADIAYITIKRDIERGAVVYDVEFVTNDWTEYDYTIDSTSGEIVGFDQEMDDRAFMQNRGGQGNGAGAGSTQEATISIDDAKAKVLERVPGASAQDIWIKLDYDDGRLEYEGELYHGGMEYEFKIDAYSGSVLEWESERM